MFAVRSSQALSDDKISRTERGGGRRQAPAASATALRRAEALSSGGSASTAPRASSHRRSIACSKASGAGRSATSPSASNSAATHSNFLGGSPVAPAPKTRLAISPAARCSIAASVAWKTSAASRTQLPTMPSSSLAILTRRDCSRASFFSCSIGLPLELVAIARSQGGGVTSPARPTARTRRSSSPPSASCCASSCLLAPLTGSRQTEVWSSVKSSSCMHCSGSCRTSTVSASAAMRRASSTGPTNSGFARKQRRASRERCLQKHACLALALHWLSALRCG
mmetsp:Transcript_65558/g.165186  ORF Transcript_65558/g.165186 Transcript_65558/m.165186 type:complete len:282 (+) Transcript_65558:2-847(+)